ncbi:MAG: ABC transporter substrate-binding protein [Acetobacteraceae bacterium]|nr:ABC transporter substrate-binding protein [Acetobacteraceae bacterium]
MMRMRSLFVVLALGFAAPVQAGGILTLAQAQDPASYDPIDTFLISWGQIGSNVFDGLVQRGADMAIKPALATSWEFLDGGARMRFKLRQGVTFQNGEAFDATAVKFTFDRLLGPDGAKGPQQSNYNAIGSVEIVDPFTVDIVMKRPDPVILTKFAGYGAMIVPPKYITDVGKDVFKIKPIGTGPFKVVDYQPKVSLTLEPYAKHWEGISKLDKLIYRFIVEPDTQVAELQAGRIDIATNVPVSLVPAIEKTATLKVESITGPSVTVLRFNTANGITKDERVRKAMIMAVDRETIVKTILQGHAKTVVSNQSALSFGFDPNQKPVPFDPAGARALLKAAGIAPGTPAQIDFQSNNPLFREVAQAVAGYLTAVGLKGGVKGYEMNIMTNDIIPNGKTAEMFQFGWGGWTFDYDNTAYLLYHSGERWNPYDKDPILDKMLEDQRLSSDRAQREKLLQGVAHYVADHALEIPMYNLNTIFGVNKRVKGLVPPADNRFRLTDVTVD